MPYSQRVRPLGRNPSRAVYPRKVVARKTRPTINARRQPEQVTITGSEGELVISPPDPDGTPRRRGPQGKRILNGAETQLNADLGSWAIDE
jgi:hypothetical protein